MKIIEYKEFNIKIIYTNEINRSDIKEFLNVFNIVFKSQKTEKWFCYKYLKNIYGNSLILMCYKNKECVGIQSFIRNDINNIKAYQSGDSAVLPSCQGKGIFYTLVNLGIKELEKDSYIYGFPNNNSLPIFLKHNWNLRERKKLKIILKKELVKMEEKIENKYLKYLLESFNNKLCYIEYNSKYYLLQKKIYNIYIVLGEIEKNYKIKKVKFPILLKYDKSGRIGNGAVLIENRKTNICVPIYKIDTLIS